MRKYMFDDKRQFKAFVTRLPCFELACRRCDTLSGRVLVVGVSAATLLRRKCISYACARQEFQELRACLSARQILAVNYSSSSHSEGAIEPFAHTENNGVEL